MSLRSQNKKRSSKQRKKTVRTTNYKQQLIYRQIIVGILLTLFLAALITATYKVSRIDSLQITKVEVVGNKTVPPGKVVGITKKAFTGTYFHLIPKSFRPTFPVDTVISRVKAIDRIKEVEVDLNDDTVLVKYKEYIPIGLWCENKEDDDCLFLDNEGYAFTEAPELDGNAFLRFISGGVTFGKHQAVFSPKFMSNNLLFAEHLRSETGWYITHIEKVDDYDIEYTLVGGGIIKVSQMINIDTTFKNLLTILKSNEFSHLKPDNFEYIDLRFGDKVFVNEEEIEEKVAEEGAETVIDTIELPDESGLE